MIITFDFSGYWQVYSMLLLSMAGIWGFKRVKSLLSGR